MPNPHSGTCLCGASSYHFTGPIKFAIQCHCTDCQHVSGGGHMPQIGTEHAGFSPAGDIKAYTRPSDAGNALTFSFCGTCGSPLFKTTSKMPDTVFVYPGSLQTPLDVTFDTHEDSRQSWDAS